MNTNIKYQISNIKRRTPATVNPIRQTVNPIRHTPYTLLLLLFLCACQTKDEVPAGTLSEEKMAEVLTQVHLIEGRVARLSILSFDSTALVTEHLKNAMFKKMKIDTAAYNRSYRFYSTHPEYFERIYEQVTKDLEKRVKKDDLRSPTAPTKPTALPK